MSSKRISLEAAMLRMEALYAESRKEVPDFKEMYYRTEILWYDVLRSIADPENTTSKTDLSGVAAVVLEAKTICESSKSKATIAMRRQNDEIKRRFVARGKRKMRVDCAKLSTED